MRLKRTPKNIPEKVLIKVLAHIEQIRVVISLL